MAGNNAYLKKKAALEQGFLDVGEEMGIQKTWDYIQLALRDPEVMGKDTFGRKRMEKLYKKLVELVGHYHIAFTDDVEADHRQEELDNNLREIWGDDLKTFYERYPHLKRMDYSKKKKGWV